VAGPEAAAAAAPAARPVWPAAAVVDDRESRHAPPRPPHPRRPRLPHAGRVGLHPHAATWTCRHLALGRRALGGPPRRRARRVRGLVATLARFEDVVVNVTDDEAEADARGGCGGGADLGGCASTASRSTTPGSATTARSSSSTATAGWRSPTGASTPGAASTPSTATTGAPAAVAARPGHAALRVPYVLEGGAIEVNDEGVCLTTRSCLLTPTRNPGSTRPIEALLRAGTSGCGTWCGSTRARGRPHRRPRRHDRALRRRPHHRVRRRPRTRTTPTTPACSATSPRCGR
jgi:hypothetical protein